jgi:hypothetical protein
MGSGVARQCSGNRCLARWTVWIPPSWPPRRNRLSELEEKTWSRARSEVLVPYRPGTSSPTPELPPPQGMTVLEGADE